MECLRQSKLLGGLLTVPIEFLRQNVKPTWPELVWAYEMAILGWKNLTDVAEAEVESGRDDVSMVELAGVGRSDSWRAIEIAQDIAARCGAVNQESCQRKWLHLLLKCLYERRDQFSDPLQIVEQLYADFDYPEEIAGFVRWMPARESVSGEAEGLQRIEKEWKAYLERTEP